MKIHINKILPPKGFCAITLFGHVFVREDELLYLNGSRWDTMLFHENLHIKQAKKEGGWFLFYVKYLFYWLRLMFKCKFQNTIAYYCIPYEIDAYIHENDFRKGRDYNCEDIELLKKLSADLLIETFKRGHHEAIKQLIYEKTK